LVETARCPPGLSARVHRDPYTPNRPARKLTNQFLRKARALISLLSSGPILAV